MEQVRASRKRRCNKAQHAGIETIWSVIKQQTGTGKKPNGAGAGYAPTRFTTKNCDLNTCDAFNKYAKRTGVSYTDYRFVHPMEVPAYSQN
jgi:hypothetical protein